jgi:L-alanine-DL-glutamate epimerase-like enolase superfamily enzyme
MVTATGMRIENGRAIPSVEPGLGIDWDWDKLKHFQAHATEHR